MRRRMRSRAIVDCYLECRVDGEELADVVERVRPELFADLLAERMPGVFVPSRTDEMEEAS